MCLGNVHMVTFWVIIFTFPRCVKGFHIATFVIQLLFLGSTQTAVLLPQSIPHLAKNLVRLALESCRIWGHCLTSHVFLYEASPLYDLTVAHSIDRPSFMYRLEKTGGRPSLVMIRIGVNFSTS